MCVLFKVWLILLRISKLQCDQMDRDVSLRRKLFYELRYSSTFTIQGPDLILAWEFLKQFSFIQVLEFSLGKK